MSRNSFSAANELFQALAEVDVVPPITTSTLTTHQDVSQAIDMDIR
jgi:hypothetical protein